jgi:hypothetical protein
MEQLYTNLGVSSSDTISRQTNGYSSKMQFSRWISMGCILFLLLITGVLHAQTVLISPTGDGSFEGVNFAADGWQTLQGATPTHNNFSIGNAATIGFTPTHGTRGVFVTNNGTSRGYAHTSSIAWIYKEITIPAGESVVRMTMDLFGNTGDAGFDGIIVGHSDISFTGSITTGATGAMSGTVISGMSIAATSTSNGFIEDGNYAVATNRTFNLTGVGNEANPVTRRIWIGFRCDGSDGNLTTPYSFDSVSLTSQAPLQYVWNATTGTASWSDPASWTPARTTPNLSDVLNFSLGGNSTATIPSTGAIGGQVIFANNTSASFQAATTTATTLTLSGLNIPSGSTLLSDGATGNLTLAFSAGSTNTINGRLESINGTGRNNAFNFTNAITTVGANGTLAAGGVSAATLTSTAANLTINGTYEHKYTTVGGTLPTATWADGSNCNIIGYTTVTAHPSYAQSFWNFTWNCPNQTTTITGAIGAAWAARNNLNLISTGTGTFVNSGTSTHNMRNIIMSGGTFNLASSTATYNITGDFTKTGGTMTPTGACTFNFSGTSTAQNLTLDALVANPATWRFSNPLGVTITGTGSFPAAFPIGNGTSGGVRISTTAVAPLTFAGTITNGFSYNATNSTLTYDAAGSYSARDIEFPLNNGPARLTVGIGAGNVLTVPFSRTISGILTMTSGDIDISSNNFTLGTSTTALGTLTYTAGAIRVTTGSFTRWFGTTGLPTAAGTAIGFFPLASASNNRNVSVYFSTATALSAGGTITATHANAGGLSAVTPSFLDGAITIDTRTNSAWSFQTGNGIAASGTIGVRLTGGGAINTTTVANLRLVQETAAAGVSVNGTGTFPNFQAARTGLTLANLAGPHYIGGASTDIQAITNSIASGDWNNPTTWDTNVVPGCADIVNILPNHNVTVNSAANNARNLTIALGGTLSVTSGDLTVGCTLNNNLLNNNGTLNVSGGTLNINGNYSGNAGSTLVQSGGNIVVDGSDGLTANSVPTLTPIVRIIATAPANLSLTGGTLTIIDPHAGTSTTSDLGLSISQGGAANTASSNHTVKFGNGSSTTSGGHANGMAMNLFVGAFYYTLGNVEVDMLTGTNRIVRSSTGFVPMAGNLNIISGDYQMVNANIIAGNVTNNGTLTAQNTLILANFLPPSSVAPSSVAQSISGTGVFRNLPSSPTAELTALQVFNNSSSGLTLNVPLSISGTLTMTGAIINTTSTNLLTLGSASTIGGNPPSATNMINGPLARTIAPGNANSNYIHFPVGKGTAYAPVWLAPTTTAVTNMRAEAFIGNSGTTDASITNLSTNRRWEAPLISGTITDVNVRLGDSGILSTSIPVQAPSAAGQYTNAFGSVATAIAGVTTQSNTPASGAIYTGFLSFADSNACLGTPSPGNTIASANNICAGQSLTLSLQNTTPGTGVTYQWKSSTDGVQFTNVDGAINPTLVVSPTVSTYYLCEVTCAAGPSTGASTAVQINFANNVASTTPGTRCGEGTVTLGATPSSGATIRWFENATGGVPLATGNSFTTPVISSNTTYYAAAQGAQQGNIQIGTASTLTGATTQPSAFVNRWPSYRIQTLYTAQELIEAGLAPGDITSMSYFTTTLGDGATNANFTVRIGVTNQSVMTTTWVPTAAFTNVYGPVTHTHTPSGEQPINFTTPFEWDGTSNIVIDVSYNGADLSNNAITFFTATANPMVVHSNSSGSAASTGTTTTTRLNLKLVGQVACSSARVPVIATVTTPPTFSLSSNAQTICAGDSSATITISAGANDYDTFVWSPSTGVSGDAINGWTFNPTTTTNYTLTVSQTTGDLCATTANVQVNVNPLPSALVITPSATETCIDNVVTLSATGGNFDTTLYQQSMNSTPSDFTLNNIAGVGTAVINSTYFTEGSSSLLLTTSSINANVSYQLNSNLDLTGATSASIVFSHIAAMEGPSTSYDYGIIEYSTDGGSSWSLIPASNYLGSANNTVFNGNIRFSARSYPDWIATFTSSSSTPGVGPATSLWKTETINVPAVALNSNQFRIRFRYTTDSLTNYYGWLIDDVKIIKAINNVTWSPIVDLYTDSQANTAYIAGTPSVTVYYKPTTASSVQFTATSNSQAGCYVNQNVSIVTNPTPEAPTADAQVFCGTSTVANLVATGTALQWYDVVTGGTPLASNASIATGTYYVSQTLNNCEGPRTSVAVTVNITPAPTVSNQEFCNSATVANLVATGTALQWYNVATGGTALASTTALTTGTYYVSQTLNNCEGPRTLVEVIVNAPEAPTGNALQSFCGAANLSQLQVTGTGIKIYTAATGGTEYPQALWNLIGLVNGSSYYASQTINGCESATRLEITVTINPVPTAPTASNQSFCGNINATVADLVASGTNLQWYDVASGGTALDPTTALMSGTYYVSQVSGDCESTRTSVVVTIDDCNIGWGNLQWPPSGTINTCGDYTVYGRVWKQGATEAPGPNANITAWFGISTTNTDPSTWPSSAWVLGTYNVQVGNDDEYQHTFSNLPSGTYYIASRYQFTGGDFWYGGFNSGGEGAWNGTSNVSSVLTVEEVPTPTGDALQSVTVPLAPDATLANLVVSGTNVTWYATLADAQAGTNALPLSTVLVSGNTYYAVSIVNGCRSAALAVTVTVNLDIRVFDFAQLRVYPNPVIDRLTITFDHQLERIEVYNMLGQMVRFQQPNFTETEVDMINLPAATYIVRIYSNDSVKEVKVIKK